MREMRYRLLGKSGLRVSEVALGTMTFSPAAGRDAAVPTPGSSWSWCAREDDARRILASYLDIGGNVVDTANLYAGGTAEPFVGELVAPVRDRVVLATKYGLSTDDSDVASGGSSTRTLLRSVDTSLRRLRTDRIDLLWLHAWDGITPLDEVARGLDQVVRSGKVLYVGVSDTPAWAIATIHALGVVRGTPLTAVQLRYSVLDRSAELELLPMAANLGLGVAAFGVIGGGVLSGKYASGATGRRDAESLSAHEVAAAATVARIAAAHGCTPTQVAVAWVLAAELHGVPVMPILGARTPAQMDDALGALGIAFEAADRAALDAIAPPPLAFPHDVISAVVPKLRGGVHHERLLLAHPDRPSHHDITGS